MAIQTILLTVAKTVLTSVLTEKVILNFAVILLEWLVKRTSNQLDDQLLRALKDALDNNPAKANTTNLYREIK